MPVFGGMRSVLGWATVGLKADATRLKQDVKREGQEAARNPIKLDVKADTSKLRPDVQKEVEEVEATIEQAIRTFADTQRYKEDLEAKVKAAAAQVKAETGVEIPQAELNRQVRKAVKVAQATAPKVKIETKVDEDAIGGWTKLRRVLIGAGAGALGFKTAIFAIKWPAIQAAGQQLAAAITTLSAALTALTGSTLLAGGALGSLPGIFAAVLQGVGAIALAFMGIGDTIKAASKSIEDNGNMARQNARAQKQAAKRVEEAYESRAEAAEAAAEREQAANERVTEATENYRRTQEAVAEQQVRDAERVEAAERRLARAQDQHRRSQEDLTRAREDEAKALADMRREQERLAMDEEAQILAVEEAREAREATFEDEGSSERERQRADLRYRQEKARLEDIRRARQENREAISKADREGIEGSERVRAAREREEDANLAVRDSERELAEARKDQTRNAIESAAAVAAAFAAIGEADRDRTRTIRDNAKTMEDAADRVAEALEGVEEAALNAARNIDPLVEQMNKLSPAAQKFANYILSLRPQFEELKGVVAAGLFPGLEDGIRGAMTNFEALKRRLGETGEVIGDTAKRAGELMATDLFRDDFDRIMGNNNKLLGDMGQGFINIFSAIRHMMVGAEDLTDWLGESFVKWTEWIDKTLEAKRETGALKEFFDNTRESLSKFFEIFGNVWSTLFNIFKAGNETGQGFLDSMVQVTQQWQDWSRSVEGNQTLQRWFDSAKEVMRELSALISDIFRDIFEISGEGRGLAGTLKFVRTDILPVLTEFFKSADTKEFLRDFLALIRDALDLFGKLAGQTGPLGGFVEVLGRMFRLLSWFLSIPVLGPLTAQLGSLYGTLKLLGVIKLGKWAGELMGINWGQLATKLFGFGKAADDVAGAAAGAGKAARTGGGLLGALGRVAGFLKGGGVWGVAIGAGVAALSYFFSQTETGERFMGRFKDAMQRDVDTVKKAWSDFTGRFASDSDKWKAKLAELDPSARKVVGLLQSSEQALMASYLKHGQITAETAETVTGNVTRMTDIVVAKLNEKRDKGIAAATALRDQGGILSAEEVARITANYTQGNIEQVAKVEERKRLIIEKLQALRDSGQTITKEMMTSMLAELNAAGEEAVSITETDRRKRTDILTMLKAESGMISGETARKLKADANETYRETVAAADKQYRETISHLNQLKRDGMFASEEKFQQAVRKARDEKAATVEEARLGKEGIVAEVNAAMRGTKAAFETEGPRARRALKTEFDLMEEDAKKSTGGVLQRFLDLFKNLGDIRWGHLRAQWPWTRFSPSIMEIDALKTREGVVRQFNKMAADLSSVRFSKVGPTAEFNPGSPGAFDPSGGGAMPGGGVKIDNLNVTSQHPGDIAGPVAFELGWQMTRRAYARR